MLLVELSVERASDSFGANAMIVHAYSSASSLNSFAPPGEVLYMPSGRSTIQARVDGEPKEIDVNVTAETAAVLQADLEKLLARNIKPYVDFDHKGEAAAAIPKRFRWVAGKGVFLELEWTRSGRDYSYFSPSFIASREGSPAGLPDNGAIGALVNNPAFRDMQRIAASHASVKSTRPLDPLEKMRSQKRVIAHFRSAHPDMHTEAVFRQLIRLNPEYWKD